MASVLRALQSTGWHIQDHQHMESSQRHHGISHSIALMGSMNSSRQTENLLINAYFHLFHPSYPLIHEPTFRAQHNGLVSRRNEFSWKFLLDAVLAISAWCLGQDDTVSRNPYYAQALKSFNGPAVFEIGDVSMVQGLMLLSNYAQKQNMPNVAWNYLGFALRVATSLALHKELPQWRISVLDREIRRRVWWCLYIFNSGAAITFGRPLLLPDPLTIDIEEVANVHDAVSDKTHSVIISIVELLRDFLRT